MLHSDKQGAIGRVVDFDEAAQYPGSEFVWRRELHETGVDLVVLGLLPLARWSDEARLGIRRGSFAIECILKGDLQALNLVAVRQSSVVEARSRSGVCGIGRCGRLVQITPNEAQAKDALPVYIAAAEKASKGAFLEGRVDIDAPHILVDDTVLCHGVLANLVLGCLSKQPATVIGEESNGEHSLPTLGGKLSLFE